MTQAFRDSPYFRAVDEALDGALTHVESRGTTFDLVGDNCAAAGAGRAGSGGGAGGACDASGAGGSAEEGGAHHAGGAGCADNDNSGSPVAAAVDAAAADRAPHHEIEPMTKNVTLLAMAIAADGVQLHDKSIATTLVVLAKCLGLPAHLVHTEMAAYSFGYIGGPKEPTTLTEFLALIIAQFEQHAPYVRHVDGTGVLLCNSF